MHHGETEQIKEGTSRFGKMTFVAGLVLVLLLIGAGMVGYEIFLFGDDNGEGEDMPITSFEECVDAGYPVMESYPEQCRTPDGETFVRDIGNELEKNDVIRIENPRPGTQISSPLTITGQARGTWYFEATFPIVLRDADGNILARHYATAQDEWMTEEFVSFRAELTFEAPEAETGTLVLEKANPSGLPENEDSLSVPVIFSTETTTPEPTQEEARTPGAYDGCVITGCSGQVCAGEEVMTTCEYREEYACYEVAVCERQQDSSCGWTMSEGLQQCLAGS